MAGPKKGEPTKYQWLLAKLEELRLAPTDECVEWPWGCKPKGYGVVRCPGGSKHTTSRVACSFAHPPEAGKPYTLHTCDNPPCFNPRHLFWGNHKGNMEDMVRKGRAGEKGGEANPRALLREIDVRQIRRRGGGLGVGAMAREYGVTRWTIHDILSRKRWKHIT